MVVTVMLMERIRIIITNMVGRVEGIVVLEVVHGRGCDYHFVEQGLGVAGYLASGNVVVTILVFEPVSKCKIIH